MNVTIYTTMLCGFCYRAKKLLSAKGIEFREIDVTLRPGARAEMARRAGGRTSVPQVFIGETHIGGCVELFALEREGGLAPLLEGAG